MTVERTDSLAARAERGVFGVHIEGCSRLWVSSIPVGPDGNPWTAPTDHRGESYTVEEALIARDGLASTDSTWKPKEGVSEGGAFDVRLVATADVRDWFATEKSGRESQAIQADTDYDASGVASASRYAVYVEDATAYDSQGYVYVGRETIHYDTVNATANTLGDGTSTYMDRGCWNWQSDSALSRHHYSSTDTLKQTVYASSHPEVQRGRRVTVLYWQADEHGRCYDSGYKGDHEIEIRSGFIRSFGPASGNWAEFNVSCDDLTSALRNEIGAPLVTCEATPQPGTIWIGLPVQFFLRVDVVSGGSAAPLDNVLVSVKGTDDTVLQNATVSVERFADAVAYTIQDAVNSVTADTLSATGIVETFTDGMTGNSAYKIGISIANDSTGTGADEYRYIKTTKYGQYAQNAWMEFSHGTSTATAAAFPDAEIFFNNSEGIVNVFVGGISEDAPSLRVTVQGQDGEIPDVPSSGYAKITQGDLVEWVSFDSVTEGEANGVPEGQAILGLSARGLFGTSPAKNFEPGDNGEWDVSVEIFYGWQNETFGDIIAQMLVSTGTSGAYGTQDTLNRRYGLALDPASVDVDAIRYLDVLNVQRDWLLADETSVESIVKDEAILNGWVLTARTGRDGRYRLTAVPVQQPTLVASSGSFSVADGTIADPHPTIRSTTGDLINEVRVSVSLDPVGESTGTTFRVIDTGGRETYGESKTLELATRGFGASTQAAVLAAAHRLFFLFGRPYWVVEFETDRSGLAIQAGDTVDVTIPGAWTPAGSTGFTSQPGTVLQINKNWFATGNATAAKIAAVIFPPSRGLAPTFEVDSYDSGTPSITISDNVYTEATDPSPLGEATSKDWHHGPSSGETWPVWVYQKGDIGNREAHTVTSDGTSTWVLDSTLTMTVGSSDTFVEFADYTNASIAADMKLYSYIADTNKTLGSAPDSAHEWAA